MNSQEVLELANIIENDNENINSLSDIEIDREVISFIKKHIRNIESDTIFLDTRTRFNIDILPYKVRNIINIHRINDIRWLNKFFESVNKKLKNEGIFIGCVETFIERKHRIFRKYPFFIAYPYYAFDFIFKRAFPKMFFTKKFYYFITQGYNRLLSRAETFGRLVSCGFEIIDYEEINNHIFYAVRKTGEPKYDDTPTYGLFIKLRRVGYKGKLFNVYKFRTMHPYSEYLQEYVYKTNNIKEGGKFQNDFRITYWGAWLRKLWLDELPMIWNLIKGDLKLFGVRPLSKQYYNMYDDDLKQKRIKYKPGLIPPFYADMPKTLQEIMDSERNYLIKYEASPFLTDLKYLLKALMNIVIKHQRSS